MEDIKGVIKIFGKSNPFADSSIVANMINSFINGTKQDVDRLKVTVHKLEMQGAIQQIDISTVNHLTAKIAVLEKQYRALDDKLNKLLQKK